MALQGTIETFALPDVLRLLATSNKTGKLAVDGDRGLGSLWVADGAIVASEIDLGAHPSTGSTDVQEGLFQILRFETGEFVFTADDAADHAGSPHDVESSIAASSTMLDELNQISENVPSVSSFVSLNSEIDTPEVTLTADQWSVLSAVGGGTTVAAIASSFSFGELDALRRVDDLVNEGVIGVSETSQASPAPVSTDELVDEPNFDGEDASLIASDSEDPFAADQPAFEESSLDEPGTEEHSSDDAVVSAEDEMEDPFAAVASEAPEFEEAPLVDDPVADPFAPAESAVADDPFAPAAEASADPFASPEVSEPVAEAVDPFASIDESAGDPITEGGHTEEASADIDPFAPAAGTVAGGATGGVLHDVFGSTEADTDPAWDPAVEVASEEASAEWPVPNVAGEVDADAPWSVDGVTEEAASQLPPPPAAMAADGLDTPLDETVSQLPPPPAIDGLEGFESPIESSESELPPPPARDSGIGETDETSEIGEISDTGLASEAPDAEVSGVASFPEAPVAPPESSVASDTNNMARQLASLSPAAAQAVANAAKADTPAARDQALAEVEAEDSSVDRSLLMRFLGKSDKKDS